jgi:hypothetical protein
MTEPNSFQNKCVEELLKKLKPFGIKELNFTTKQERQWYPGAGVLVETSINHLEIWIYADGAHIRGVDVNLPFEALDYTTEEDLITAFTEKVVALLKTHRGNEGDVDHCRD